MFANGLQGDCRWAVALVRWAAEEIGMRTIRVDLIAYEGDDHAVCIAWFKENEWYYFTPYILYGIIYSDDWRAAVLESYKGIFETTKIYER